MRNFSDLSEREILALAIGSEEEDRRIYADLAYELRGEYPAIANSVAEMAGHEDDHRRLLTKAYQERFGPHVPLIRRHEVRGFLHHRPHWQFRSLRPEEVRHRIRLMEEEAERFYRSAAGRTDDPSIRALLTALADAETVHTDAAERIASEQAAPPHGHPDEAHRQRFLLQVVQPGLVGLMDGSVSTLAPVFAAAFASGRPWEAFVVGMAASLGAGISMGFAEALSDNGSLTGRGAPLLRGLICGAMTTLGGIGHTLPFLIPVFWTAMTVAVLVLVIELAVISYIRWRYMDTPLLSATLQVAFGGALVFAAGILIGSS